MPTAVFHQAIRGGFMAVMIGVDPHKGSHTAVAIDDVEGPLGEVKVRASAGQVERLLDWAVPFGERTWAVEGAGGLGYLLAQQLVAAGEHVVDVPPKLAARVRLLASGKSNKNDSNDARSVAVAALRSRTSEQDRLPTALGAVRAGARGHRRGDECRPSRRSVGSIRAGRRHRDRTT